MGSPSVPSPLKPPPPADTTKAMLDAFQYADTQKKIRASTGWQSMFLNQTPTAGKTLLGQ